MEQKIKLILIGLLGALLALGFLFLQEMNSKQALQKEKDRLSEENASLNTKFSKISADYSLFDKKMASINSEIEEARKAKEEVVSKCDLLEKEKATLLKEVDSLMIKLKKKEEAPVAVVAPEIPADAYWANVLKEKTNLEMQLDRLKSEIKSQGFNNEEVLRAKSDLEMEVKNLDLEKQDLKRQLEYSQKQLVYNQKAIDSLTLELVGEKNDKMQINNTLKAVKNENAILRNRLALLTDRKINLERKIQELQDNNAKFERRFNEMDILLKDKIIQIDKIQKDVSSDASFGSSVFGDKTSVELPPIVVKPQSSSVAGSTSSKGKIVALNKENNFIITDLGSDAGTNVGDRFNIYREGKQIGQVEVIQVRNAISACDIKKQTSQFKVGDNVK